MCQLVGWDSVRVTVLGGTLRGINETIIGTEAEAMLGSVYATTAFIGTDAVDPVLGITSRTYEQARLKTTMMQHARQVYVVADSSKLGDHAPFHYWSKLPAGWGLITDAGAAVADLAALRAAGAAQTLIAPPPPAVPAQPLAVTGAALA